MADTAQLIQEQYPFFGFLLNDPEVGPLLARAVTPATQFSPERFSPERFQAELMKTDYYRSRTAAQRQWEILVNSDPQEANRRRNEFAMAINDVTAKAGFQMTYPEWAWLTESLLSGGVQPGSAEFNWNIRQLIQGQIGTGRMLQGGIMGAANRILGQATGEYFVPVDDKDIYKMAIDSTLGYMNDEAIRYNLQERASSRYPWLRPQLDQGLSMRDLFSGHLQTLAEEWELQPGQIRYDDPTMQRLIGVRDPQTGEMRASSLYEAKTYARQDDKFYSTSRWHQMDANITNTLLKAFGKRAA